MLSTGEVPAGLLCLFFILLPVHYRNGETVEDPADSNPSSGLIDSMISTERLVIQAWLVWQREGWEVSAWDLLVSEGQLQGWWSQVVLSNTRQCEKGWWQNWLASLSVDLKKKHLPWSTSSSLEEGVCIGCDISIFGVFETLSGRKNNLVFAVVPLDRSWTRWHPKRQLNRLLHLGNS